MEEFFTWPKSLNWQEVTHSFLIISIIGVFVSSIINKKTKSCPVFAVQVSVLLTLIIYPLVNTYLYMATVSDYEFTEKIVDLSYGPFIFFVPLPVCILVAAMFYIYREKKRVNDSTETAPDAKGNIRLRVVAWALAVLAGGFWLSYTMAIERVPYHFTVLRFLAYTVYGFVAYLVVELVLLVIKLFFAAGVQQEKQKN